MLLTYDFLKLNVVEVEIKKELNMGPFEDFLDQVNGVMIDGLNCNDEGDAIIQIGVKGKLYVQPYNNWFEMTISGYSFDVALDDDEINNYIKGLKVIGPNKHFVKEA